MEDIRVASRCRSVRKHKVIQNVFNIRLSRQLNELKTMRLMCKKKKIKKKKKKFCATYHFRFCDILPVFNELPLELFRNDEIELDRFISILRDGIILKRSGTRMDARAGMNAPTSKSLRLRFFLSLPFLLLFRDAITSILRSCCFFKFSSLYFRRRLESTHSSYLGGESKSSSVGCQAVI
jgi:hypothetical protein